MPRAGFYNDNEYRAYPFVFKSEYSGVKIPNNGIVDCGFILGLDSEYDPSVHSVYLAEITRANNMINFVFKTDAPGAADFPITFTVPETADEWQTIFSESASNTANNFCAEEPAWEGFIVTGTFDEEFLAAIPVNVYYPEMITIEDTPDYVVEPARIQSLVRAYVRAINVANYARPRIPSCDELASSSSSGENPPAREIIVNGTCAKGKIKLLAGYNCAIKQDDVANTITVQTFKRDRGNDDPTAEICQYGSELPLYPEQVPPAGSQFLSGGPSCADLITSINGVSGVNVTIAAEAGIQIVVTEENSIKIDVTPNIIQQNCG